MSLTIITTPSQWARVGDTNRMNYKFSSTKYTEPNFQFQFYMMSFNVITNDYEELGYFNLHPSADGSVEFNPSAIYANYLSHDLDITITGLTELTQMAHKFQLYCYEYYGTPPTTHIQDGVFTDILYVYNAAQQNIPYDYTPLNSQGNLKWVMSRISGQTGQFLTDATEFKLGNEDYGFLYALGEHYNLGRPNKIKYTIAYIPQGLTSGTTTTMTFVNGIFHNPSLATLVCGTTYQVAAGSVEWWEEGDTFTGTIWTAGYSFVWTGVPVGFYPNFKNTWLTYSIPYYPDEYNTNTILKDLPSYEQSMPNSSQKVQAQTAPYVAQDIFSDGNGIRRTLPSGGFYSLSQGLDYWVAVWPGGSPYYSDVHRVGDGDPLPTPDSYTQWDNVNSLTGEYISADYPLVIRYDTGITILYDLLSIGYYIPIGPGNQPDTILSGLTDTWVYYDIDLIYSDLSGDTTLNTYPIRVNKGCYSDKYDKWQLFWMNPHGGFDTYIFNKKVDIDYKIKKSTYKQKIPPTFSPYTAGEKVFNVNVEEEITLRSDLLTQKESQLLTQLVQSPVVYALKYYLYNDVRTYFVVPYIITTEDWKYEQKKNNKEIFVELKMRASNSKIIQKN